MKGNSMKDKLYIATYSKDAPKVCREFGIGLELNDFCISEYLDEDKRSQAFDYIKEEIEESGAENLLMHGPFTEIIPASIDHRACELGLVRLEEAYTVAKEMGISRMIVHSGYIPLLYFKEWHHEKSVYFWKTFMEKKPSDFTIYIENVFEDEPLMMKELIDELSDPRIKICLDVGHANVCTTDDYSVEKWIELLGRRIGHFHLHNNDGKSDSHREINAGVMDMENILKTALIHCPDATFTVESRTCRESVQWLMDFEKKHNR